MAHGHRSLTLAGQYMMKDMLHLVTGENGSTLHAWAVFIAGVFVLIALSLSSFLLVEHLTSYKKPEEQKWLIGVIFMVPIYSVESFLSLWNPNLAKECDILRNCYEAFALYCFTSYLIACLGGDDRAVEFLNRQAKAGPRTPLLVHSGGEAAVKHPLPLNLCLAPWTLGQSFYDIVKFGIVQYMILKTVCAFLALVLELFHAYGDGEFKWYYGYPYITVVLNFSQTWALYCLVQFYAVVGDELQSIKPLAKFICFKSIVFATWWQGVFLAIIFGSGVPGTSIQNGARFQASLQDFIICIEMAIAAIAHIYIFPASPYQLVSEYNHGKVSVLADYASLDSALDPEEVKESERTPIRQFLPPDMKYVATSLKSSVEDLFFVGGEQVVNDVKATVSQAVEPMEKGIHRLNEKLHHLPWKAKHRDKENKKQSKDDTLLSSSTGSDRAHIHGIDDPLLTGSISDTAAVVRGRWSKDLHGSGAESSGESSDQGLGGFRTSGRRWTVKK